MTMHATVLEVRECDLLVCDHCNGQHVVVHTKDTCRFCRCDHVCIEYEGAMTASLPPQITATCVVLVCRPCGHHCH